MADPSLVTVGAVACLAGAGFAGSALRTQRAHRRWCATRTKTDGVVSRLVDRRRAGGLIEDVAGIPADPATETVPVVRFRALDDIEYEIDAPEAPRQVGSVVAVAYDPALPSGGRAVVRSPKVGCAALLLLVGLLVLAVGASLG
jgi:hypothetical protein